MHVALERDETMTIEIFIWPVGPSLASRQNINIILALAADRLVA